MYKHLLFDWGNTLMVDKPECLGPMYLWPSVDLCDGAAETLAMLCPHYKCHLASNAADSTEEEIRMALQRGGIDSFISEVFCYRSLGFEKPSKAYFSAILARLNCEREEVLMIGDSWEKDIIGAQSSGIDAVWITPSETSRSDSAKVIHRLSDLPSVLTPQGNSE